MSPVKRRQPKMEQELLAAFERLSNGSPKNPHLKAKSNRGSLKINPSTVAQEAGCSRTLVGFDGCRYPKVRMLIQQHQASCESPSVRRDVVESLRKQVADLQNKLAQARSLLAAQRITIEAMNQSNATRQGTNLG
jgi:hypothetical protein